MNGKLPLIHVTVGNHCKPESFFSSFFKEHENVLAGCGPVQPYPSATEIFREGTRAEILYLIESGFVKLSRMGLDGSDTIIGLRGRYWLLASPVFFLGSPYPATATTLTPCHLRCITAKCLYDILKTNETFSWEMYRHLSQMILENFKEIEEVRRMSAEERLRTFLHQLIEELCPEKAQAYDHYQVPLKHHELADVIGVSSEHLCRLVKKMEQEGVIISTKGMLTIQDVSKLSPPSL